MRLRLALAVIGSLLLHALALGLLQLAGGMKSQQLIPEPASPALVPRDARRLKVRMLSVDASQIDIRQATIPALEPTARAKRDPTAYISPLAVADPRSAVAATFIAPQGERADAKSQSGNPAGGGTANPSNDAETRQAAEPLNLALPAAKPPPRTALQTYIDQQSVRPEPIAKAFNWVVLQTQPVTTEITSTRDSAGNAATKVRTSWSTYCVGSNMAQGATLYDLKSYSGNCP